jgi:diguanylate cyclase (GGDEF)-like protein
MQLSISRTLLVIYAGIALLSVVAVGVVAGWVKDRSVATLALSESRRNAELVFQNLYSVMRKGWTKDEISELIERMNTTVPDIQVGIVRSQQVADAFGEIEGDRKIRLTDPIIADVMAKGHDRLEIMGDKLRYIYPVLVGAECQTCHFNAAIGSVNGVIDITFPTDRLRIPLNFTLNTVIYAFVFMAGLLLLIVLLKVRFLVARPISRLAMHIEHIIISGDLSRRVSGRSFQWLREVRSLADNFNTLMDELESSRASLVALSKTDALTGLANRVRFAEELEREIERARRHRHNLAVIMIDLDGFKPINDRYGHAAGDLMLKQVAEALGGKVRFNDLVARLGGDEFVVLVPETSAEGVHALAAKLAGAIATASVQVSGAVVAVGASLGIALFPDHADSPAQLLAHADAAMYADKRQRKSGRTPAQTELPQ